MTVGGPHLCGKYYVALASECLWATLTTIRSLSGPFALVFGSSLVRTPSFTVGNRGVLIESHGAPAELQLCPGNFNSYHSIGKLLVRYPFANLIAEFCRMSNSKSHILSFWSAVLFLSSLSVKVLGCCLGSGVSD